MNYKYRIIVNGNEQKLLVYFDNKAWAIQTIKEWRADGRLKDTDKVVIRTIITIDDEIEFNL